VYVGMCVSIVGRFKKKQATLLGGLVSRTILIPLSNTISAAGSGRGVTT